MDVRATAGFSGQVSGAAASNDSVGFGPASPCYDGKILVRVEVARSMERGIPVCSDDQIRDAVEELLKSECSMLCEGPLDVSPSPMLSRVVENAAVCVEDTSCRESGRGSKRVVPFWDADVRVHVYALNDDGPSMETLDGDDGDDTPACSQWCLPAREFRGLWESLVLEQGVKEKLAAYMDANMEFSRRDVDRTIISWNRVVLLHGPPGTGKTTLCKALAQKLSIWHAHTFSAVYLLEINSHSLFSRWFSESGKMVARLFSFIMEMVEDDDTFLFVLVDEIESLAAARNAKSTDPADAVRAVNALLTQLDKLKERSNAMILATSNITEAIDVAFVDRADVKQYIGLPTEAARIAILESCVDELVRVGMVQRAATTTSAQLREQLRDVARRADGLSGRSLRKLPFLAYGEFAKCPDRTIQSFLAVLAKTALTFVEESCAVSS